MHGPMNLKKKVSILDTPVELPTARS